MGAGLAELPDAGQTAAYIERDDSHGEWCVHAVLGGWLMVLPRDIGLVRAVSHGGDGGAGWSRSGGGRGGSRGGGPVGARGGRGVWPPTRGRGMAVRLVMLDGGREGGVDSLGGDISDEAQGIVASVVHADKFLSPLGGLLTLLHHR